jgi:2-oxoglutarate ferredoxin oxidoreductase subunit gamma
MQRTFLMSGNGGQGIVVASKLIGAAAAATGRHCLHFARYGSEIRGTECECSLTISDSPIKTPAIISSAWGAIAMHPQYFDHVQSMMEQGGVLFYNTSLGGTFLARPDIGLLAVPATEMATKLGNPIAASLCALGAFAQYTGLVEVAHLRDALTEYIPPYRQELLELDRLALTRGAEFAKALGSSSSEPVGARS